MMLELAKIDIKTLGGNKHPCFSSHLVVVAAGAHAVVVVVVGGLGRAGLAGHDGEAAPQDERHERHQGTHQQDEVLDGLREKVAALRSEPLQA